MKDRRLEIRLSGREYDRLYALAASDPDCRMKSSGRPSLPAYIRKHIIWSGRDPDDMKRNVRSLTFQVRKIGVNINQAVRRINAGLSTGREIREILDGQQQVEDLLLQIRSLVSEESQEGKTFQSEGGDIGWPSQR